MANIFDYLDWRGDIPFSASPLNEVDNYILAKIGCADFTGILTGQAVSLPLPLVLEQYHTRYGESGYNFGALASDSIGPMMQRLPETERFRSIRLSGFVNRVIPEISEQFSALTLTLPDGTHYVTFRGTDDTIAAWKEDFMMGLSGAVPAQRDAADYLTWAASVYTGPLLVGGHSKGGNLAVFAAASVAPEIQDRIVRIYNNDGPGFPPEFLQTEGYLRIHDRLVTLLPQYTIVGTLLTQVEDYTIVKSSRFGIAAHDGFNWEVLGTSFLRCPAMSKSSRAFDETMEEMMVKMSLEERTEFVDTLFGLLQASGVQTLSDINLRKLRKALELGKEMGKEKTVPKFALDVLEGLVKQYVSVSSEQIRERIPIRLKKKDDSSR